MMEWIVTSSAMILIVIALRGLLKGKISLKLQYGLWALVLVRLLLPFSIVDSAISISNVLSAPVIREADDAVADYESAYQDAVQRHESSGTTVSDEEIRLEVQQALYDRTYEKIQQAYTQSGAAVTEVQIQAEALQQVEVISLTAVITEALPWFWAAGMVIVAAVLIGSNLHFGWKLYKSRKALDIPGVPLKVYLTDYVATPCLFGLIRPDIYLTGEVMTDSRMQSHVIAHEMSHYRQGDHIWSMLRCLCLVLHWYNPLVWAAAILSKQDAELACDEATIKALGEAERLAYGRTLIGMTCVRRDPSSLILTATTMLGTRKTLKERIALIAKKPKTALYTLIACVLVAAIAVGCTFTGAPVQTEEEKLLDRCREAVEYIQNQEHFEFTEYYELNEDSEDVLGPTTAEGRYVHSGDDWYHTRTTLDGVWEFIQIADERYRKLTTTAIPEEDNLYSAWTKTDQFDDMYSKHAWIMDLRWDDEAVEFRTYSGNGDGYESVFFTPLSVSLSKEGSQEFIRVELVRNVEIAEQATAWVLTFRFDLYSGDVTEIKREIHAVDAVDGGTQEMLILSTNTLSIYANTEEEMSAIIDGIYYGEIVTVVPTPEDPTGPTTEPSIAPDAGYEWEPAAHISLPADEYFAQTQPVESIITWLDWTAADGVTRYAADYASGLGLYVERLEEPRSIVWEVPNSEQYGNVAIMLCDGVHVYGIRQQTELVRIDLKTGKEETLFTAEQMMCGYTGDGSCKNIFILDRDWLYFTAKNNEMIRIYRIYLPDLSVEDLGGYIPEDTLPHFLDLKYNPNDRTEIICTYLNPDLQRELLNEINNPNSSYRNTSVRVGNETVDLGFVWEQKDELRLESTYYWYGPFDYLRVQLQNDRSIPGSIILTCDSGTGNRQKEEVWLALPENASDKPIIYNPDIAKFQDMLNYNNGYWYWMILGCTFEEPEDINLEYLFYNGLKAGERQDQSTYTDSEIAFLKSYALEEFGDESVWVNADKLPRETINEVLGTYLGITLDEAVIPEDWRYFEETDAYYEIRFDAYGVNSLTVTDVQTDNNGLVYVYWTANYILDTRYEEMTFINEPQMVMVLQEHLDGGYRIHMNMPVEELLRPRDEEYFRNLLTSENGYWYWRAMGCIFETPEDIDMSLLCYGGMENRQLSSTFTDDEIAFLKTQDIGITGDDSAWSNAHKLPREELNSVLQNYFGVTLDDVTIPDNWVYYSETDAYYHVKYDAYGVVRQTVTDVQFNEDGTISVYWTTPYGIHDSRIEDELAFLSDANMLMTFRETDDGSYIILSNLPVEE